MPVFRLGPLDPTDRVWKGFAFVEPVWVEAPDEASARARVSFLAHNSLTRKAPRHARPWLFSAYCACENDHPGVPALKVMTAGGRLLDRYSL